MKVYFYFTLFFFILSFKISAQDLVLKDIQSGKEKTLKPGTSFQLTTRDTPEYYRAKLLEVKDTSIIVFLTDYDASEEKELSITNIASITKPTKLHYAAYAVGSAFMVNGMFFLLVGPEVTDSPFLNRGMGVVSIAIGLIPFLKSVKTYTIGEDASIEIRADQIEPEETEMEEGFEENVPAD